jgi:hypothetical protein
MPVPVVVRLKALAVSGRGIEDEDSREKYGSLGDFFTANNTSHYLKRHIG